jgi:hypothetical protein
MARPCKLHVGHLGFFEALWWKFGQRAFCVSVKTEILISVFPARFLQTSRYFISVFL